MSVVLAVLLLMIAATVEVSALVIPGVHVPLNITPVVDISDSQWLYDAYETVLNREADAAGFRTNLAALEAARDGPGGKSAAWSVVYQGFIRSAEFASQPTLWDKASYIQRVFDTQMLQPATPSQIGYWTSQLCGYSATPATAVGCVDWVTFRSVVYGSAEYYETCPKSYFTLGSKVSSDALLLQDLFAATARLQKFNESQAINLSIPTAVAVWDQKMPVWEVPMRRRGSAPPFRWFAVTRAYLGNGKFTLVVMKSNDGVNFDEVGPIFLNSATGGSTFYDGHIAVDHSVCPPRYILSMECIGNGGAASMCTSHSTYPHRPESWSSPRIVVDGCTGGKPAACATNAAESASTGVTLIDGANKYIAWTQVYDGLGPSDPLAHTYSQFTGPLPSVDAYYGTVMGPATAGVSPPPLTMMSSEAHPWCTDAWDCNNRDKQDWKREGSWFYALYNGANYYRCNGAWGISVSRSTAPVQAGEYAARLPLGQGIPAVVDTTCGASYPVLNVMDGQLFVYYAFVNSAGTHVTMRARLVDL